MLDSARDFAGRVTFVTGPGKHSGKTTFLNRAAALVRRGGEGGLPLALLGAGYDGEVRDFISGVRKPAVPVASGDVFVTAGRFLRSGGASPELIAALPGSTALGPCCVARAARDGTVALVGPETNAGLDAALEAILAEGLARTVLVDGAVNRVTQVAGRRDASMVYALRVEPASFARSAELVRRMALLMSLPLAPASGDDGAPGSGAFRLEGALTAEIAARLPREARGVIVDDFTKIFLDGAGLASFLGARSLYVARSIRFSGFSVSCRGVSEEAFLERLGDGELGRLVSFNPYRAEPGVPEEGA
ncbi:MAG: hypothetical protein JXA15_05390 [Spirochaetales bacterium]|nr:hypothetical protein [Spirochaetales bacterium]